MQNEEDWFAGPVKQCFHPDEETLWTWLIVLSIFACVIVTLILAASTFVLSKTIKQFNMQRRKSVAKSTSTGISTMQKRMFGKAKKSSTEDPLPVVLLSYKADYDELLPIQGCSWPETIKNPLLSNIIILFIPVAPPSKASNQRRDSMYYAIIDKKVSTPSSSFQGTMILNHQLSPCAGYVCVCCKNVSKSRDICVHSQVYNAFLKHKQLLIQY